MYVWAHGTAKVYKYENAVVRGIKLYVHPYRLENNKVKPLSLGSLAQSEEPLSHKQKVRDHNPDDPLNQCFICTGKISNY